MQLLYQAEDCRQKRKESCQKKFHVSPAVQGDASLHYAPWQLQVHDRRVSEVLSEEHSDWQ